MNTATAPTNPVIQRIAQVVHRITADPVDTCAATVDESAVAEPNRLRDQIAEILPGQVIVAGTLDRRLLVTADQHRWWVADLSGRPHNTRNWPEWAQTAMQLADSSSWLTTAHLEPSAVYRLTRPVVLLAALYHPEHFPLPRFPLGISDVARAARSTLTGRVHLMDMQLGIDVADVLSAINTTTPDVLGISATFGQHDLLIEILDAVSAMNPRPLVLAGGSLTARNERILLERYSWLLLARGAGEPTIADVLSYWHGGLAKEHIRGMGYHGTARGEGTLSIGAFRKTATVRNRVQTDIFPELDLLARTFEYHGVAQLETSRGCTNYCSFCPRGHKGSWSGVTPKTLPDIVTAIGEFFDRYPHISRTLYLVDEEFIGRGPDAVSRAIDVADVLHRRGFRWETSCRIDQVIDPDRDRNWHIERVEMWRTLRTLGLRRCLFGVESGVTSILERFNKETTGEQNALAIRTLSALGVPTRFTYITFDHLMNARELAATHAFQARTDLLLRPLPHLSPEEIVDGVRDEGFVAENSTGEPFFTAISYMLVSMECLIGAAYTKKVQAQGLTGPARPSMGRLDANFVDWRIGSMSQHAQLWVDRNFALDYTLKSFEKILEGNPYRAIRDARVVIKNAAFQLLTDMMKILPHYSLNHPDPNLDESIVELMKNHLHLLRERISTTISSISPLLPETENSVLMKEFARWSESTSWKLINASDPCGS